MAAATARGSVVAAETEVTMNAMVVMRWDRRMVVGVGWWCLVEGLVGEDED